jgi:type II secretory pathway pseudopilin PulG
LEKSHSSNNASGRLRAEAGFSLVEVVIATGILATALVSLAQLFAVATVANLSARHTGTAMIYAEQKMEQLRALAYTLDTDGLPITDTTTDTSVYPPAATGGTGLSPASTNTLQSNEVGYVDYLDHLGQQLGGGTTDLAQASYIRRWSIEPLPTNPNNVVVIQVLVTRRRDRGTADLGSVARSTDEARLMTIKSRKVN